MTLPIATGRLKLRSLAGEDVPDLVEMVSHPSVARIAVNLGTDAPAIKMYIERQRAFKPFLKGMYYDLAIERQQDGRVIGLVGLMCEDHRQGMAGWVLGVDYRGKGYATEAVRALIHYAFAELGLHRVYAKTSSINTASWKLMERVGMRREAHFREAELRDGEWIDVLIYAMLAGDDDYLSKGEVHVT